MPQPKADEDRVNAPTLLDEDLMFDDILNGDSDDNADGDSPDEANAGTIGTEQFEELKTSVKQQEEFIKSLVSQNERLIEVVSEKNNPPEVEQTQNLQLPQQPADYDETAALTDPTSSSYKWRVKAEAIARDHEKQEFIKSIGQYIDGRMTERDQINKIEQMEQQLVREKKPTPEQLDGFRKFLTTQKALGMDDLWDIYAKKQGIKIETDDTQDTEDTAPSASDFAAPQHETVVDKDSLEFEKSLLKGVKGSIDRF